MLNRQQMCAALGVSESTIRRLEQDGLPFTPVGSRSKRYDLAECKAWLRAHPPITKQRTVEPSGWTPSPEFTALCKNIKLRVMPSE